MITQDLHSSWEEASRGFFLHKKAVRSPRTALWYRTYVGSLVDWATVQGIELASFTRRNLDAYLAHRQDTGRKPTTLHHDALTACVFFEWCRKNDFLKRDPLADYQVRNAPTPAKYMPTEEDVQRLLQAILNFYDPAKNFRSAKGHSAANRAFHRERTFAVELTKLDSACRIGEIFNLKCSDYEAKTQQLTIRTSKGREPRVLPVSDTLAAALASWLKIRARMMRDVPANEDEGWLFLSETGTRVNEGNYLRGLKKIIRWAGLPDGINNHSQRRFSLNRSAKKGGLLYAQGLAGHKDPKTTMVYLKIDGDYLRETHRQVNVLGELLGNTKAQKKKRMI